jgi:hypothetical protein
MPKDTLYDLLVNVEMKMFFDKIFTHIIFAENTVKVECDVETWYGYSLQTPP